MESQNTLANSSSSCKKVRLAENKERIEDIAFQEVNASGISEISKSSVKYSVYANSEISIATSILDGEDNDVKRLKKNLEDYEYKVKYLENENKHINDNLINEKKRNAKLEKKLQFVKDNQEVFMRLKEAYINMKYNEAAGRKMIEIREKGVQTWTGILCSSCMESEELRRQIDVMIEKYSELFVISPGEMEHLTNTVKYLKDLISRREESWKINMEKENRLMSYIAILDDENAKLRDTIAKIGNNKEVSGNVIDNIKLEHKLLEERKIEEMQKFVEGLTKELEKLKKIIIKYEKKFREIKEHHPVQHMSPLNDKEVKIVQQIIIKYNAKVQKRNTDEIPRSRSQSVDSERNRPCRRPSSPLKSSRSGPIRDNSTSVRPLAAKSFERSKTSSSFKPGSAIMMMDCLFD